MLQAETAVICEAARGVREHVATTVSAAAFLRNAAVLLAAESCCRGGDASLRADIATAAHLHSVGGVHHDLVDIFTLGDL